MVFFIDNKHLVVPIGVLFLITKKHLVLPGVPLGVYIYKKHLVMPLSAGCLQIFRRPTRLDMAGG